MRREKMAGGNLRERIMEVAFEQWTERTCGSDGKVLIFQYQYRHSIAGRISRLQRFPALQGSGIG